MKKKLASLVLSLAMMVQATGVMALAADSAQESILSNAEQDSIISGLQIIENAKGDFNLQDVEFSDLYVGNRIQAYEYVESGFEDVYSAFPLFYNDELVALAIEVENGKYQISSGLAAKIDDMGISNFSLVYDSHAVYLYDGTDFTFLSESLIEIPSRLNIEDGIAKDGRILLDLCDLSQSVPLGYFPALESKASNLYMCDVTWVSQGDFTNLCWAATISCIHQYITQADEPLDIVDIASEQLTGDLNQRMETRKVAIIMQQTYNLDYTYKNEAPSDTTILGNIRSGYPVYGSFTCPGHSHSGTVYAVNVISGFIYVMDPNIGSVVAYNKDGYNYSYLDENSSITWTLSRGICHTW